jgi:energy-coupling factor transporter ATP-binding protein EcfA2
MRDDGGARLNDWDEQLSSELKLQIDQVCDEAKQRIIADDWPGVDAYLKIVPRAGWHYFLNDVIGMLFRDRPGSSSEQVRDWLATENQDVRQCIKQILNEKQYAELSLIDETCLTRVDSKQGAADFAVPDQIDNYHVIRELGVGGFGRVVLARDAMLKREVVLKLPRLEKFANRDALKCFLDEAQKVATLEHPGIVTVHHVGVFRGQPYIVQQFFSGGDLGEVLKHRSFTFTETANLLASVSDSISFAHQKKIVHRDLKPANILLDSEGRPRVADFGLALHQSQQNFASGEIAGTLTYMSPEQIRGETHRMDGRSDIWALGILLYRMLVGELPFRGRELETIREQITQSQPRPPRQLNPAIPVELERICLKCLAKRMNDRYSTASDLATDLRAWLSQSASNTKELAVPVAGQDAMVQAPTTDRFRSTGKVKNDAEAVTPKGLVAFDARDQQFFLRLLPGPRDRAGLPEQVRLWKDRLESTSGDDTCQVGLIFGPSGCGKSSLVRAGILPHLSPHVRTVFVESTQSDTEKRLLTGLRKYFPEIPRELALPQIVGGFRHGKWLVPGDKVVLVFDQFEQWLQVNDIKVQNPLIEALRQCDGRTVQALILARDDFWMAISRFFQELELPLEEYKNFSAVDLFDKEHARKVLILFGLAYGRLPADGNLAPEQAKFLDEAIEQLAEHDKIICVRLALFAETVKFKTWSIDVLQALGDVQEIGSLFLEQTLHASSTNPILRVHLSKLKLVLERLLPESGSEIKGHYKSNQELASAAGLTIESADFAKVLDILDRQLRLITPVDPDIDRSAESGSRTTYYQLSHDFLVPSIRNWLQADLRRSPSGRTLLRFKAQSSEWARSHDDRNLPTLLEFIQFQRHVNLKAMKGAERNFFFRSLKQHSIRGLMLLTVVAAVGSLFLLNNLNSRKKLVAAGVQQLLLVSPEGVPPTLASLQNEKSRAIVEIKRQLSSEDLSPDQRLQCQLSLATLSEDYKTLAPLVDSIDKIPVAQWNNLFLAAAEYPKEIKSDLETIFESTEDPTLRSRLAILLFHLGDFTEFESCLSLQSGLTQLAALELAIWETRCPLENYLSYLESNLVNQGRHDELAMLFNAISQYDLERIASPDRERLVKLAKSYFDSSPSGGMHSSCEYLLTQKLDVRDLKYPERRPTNAQWKRMTCGSEGLDLVLIQPELFPVASSTEATDIATSANDGSDIAAFWASKTEMSNRMFSVFADLPENKRHFLTPWVQNGDDQAPVTNVTIVQAMAFCNWLSEQNKLTPCFEESIGEKYDTKSGWLKDTVERIPEIREFLNHVNVWKFNPEANGFRLPASIEILQCRFGLGAKSYPIELPGAVELLNRHEWYAGSNWNNFKAPHPIATKLPNFFGLFDANGNADELILLTINGPVSISQQRAIANFGSDEPKVVSCSEMPISLWTKEINIGFRIVKPKD